MQGHSSIQPICAQIICRKNMAAGVGYQHRRMAGIPSQILAAKNGCDGAHPSISLEWIISMMWDMAGYLKARDENQPFLISCRAISDNIF